MRLLALVLVGGGVLLLYLALNDSWSTVWAAVTGRSPEPATPAGSGGTGVPGTTELPPGTGSGSIIPNAPGMTA